MKKILMSIFILNSMAFATCGCYLEIKTAFETIENEIFDENVDKMISSLKKSNSLLEKNIEEFSDMTKEYSKFLKLQLVQVKEITVSKMHEKSLIKIEK